MTAEMEHADMPWHKGLLVRAAAVTVATAFLTSGSQPTRAASLLEVLYRFATGFEEPSSGLVQAADGALYGITIAARADAVGTIYRLLGGRLTALHTLTPAEGSFSGTSLVFGDDKNLYGTTGPPPGTPSGGTLFQMNPSGAFSIVHRFSATTPAGSLLQATDGNFYGTMLGLGLESAVFRIARSGEVSVLRVFALAIEGAPNSLIQAPDGYLYGTTATGGGGFSAGTIFGMSLAGDFALLYTFQNGRTDEGIGPVGVMQARDGSLWGATSGGGGPAVAFLTNRSPNPYMGSVFKLAPDRRVTTLHRFNGVDGATPLHPLIEGADGYLYGTTSGGGPFTFGTIFRISPEGKLSTVQEMTEPGAFLPLNRGRDGNIYGVRTGAMQRQSMIFRLSVKP